MYLEECGYTFTKKKTKTLRFTESYRYWVNTLLEYAMKIFSWEGLPDSLPAKEIESRLLLYGVCGITQVEGNKVIAVTPNLYGITDYYDEFTDYTFATPKNSGRVVIGNNGFIINNTQLRNATFFKIKQYATILAHCDVTINCALVNGRSNDIIQAITDKFRDSATAYRRKLEEGDPSPIVNEGFSTLKFDSKGRIEGVSLSEVYDIRQNYLTQFWEDVGLRRSSTKRERLNVDEVNANDDLLNLNISDMYANRQIGASAFDMFGLSVRCVCNIPLEDRKAVQNENDTAEI